MQLTTTTPTTMEKRLVGQLMLLKMKY